MKRRRFLSRIASLALCLIVAASFVPAEAAAAQGNTVKVGFFAFDGYHMQDQSGNRSGYGYDLVQAMSSYTGLDFEFTGYDASWSEAQDMLASGEIDMLTSAQKTKERVEKFDFSNKAIGVSSAILTVEAGNTEYTHNGYTNWSGMRVGMIKGNSRNHSFAQFAKERGFTYTAVYYEGTDEVLEALKVDNEVDAVVTSNLRRIEDEWILAQFNPSPFYVMVKKGNSDLLSEVNSTLDRLYETEPDLNVTLMSKYYSTDDGNNVAFTLKENAIIQASQKKPIKIGIILSGAPVCYLDDDSGRYKGISMDVLRIVSNKTGLVFKYVPLDLLESTPIDELKKGKVDIVARIMKTNPFINNNDLVLSDDLIADAITVIGRIDDDFTKNPTEKTIVVPVDFVTGQEYIKEYFPKHRIITLDSFDQCLEAVSSGEADAAVYIRNNALYSLLNPHYSELRTIPSFNKEVASCVAGLSSDKETLIGIVNKGLDMITDEERNAIMLNYTVLNSYELSLGDWVYKYRVPLCIIGALFIVIIGIVVLLFSMKGREEKKLQEAYRHAREALAVAENANASKSQFLSRVSHEMRTPLNAIIGFMELSKDASSQEIQEYLTNSNIAAKQLLSVINDVLDMSSIEAGKLTLAESIFDFRQLVHSVTNVFLPQCHEKGVEFETKLVTPVDEWLIGDQLRVNQILFNLLSNAVKFTQSGHIWLFISQTESKNNQVFIRFQVSDTGRGMSEDMKSRLFSPFEQENGTTAAQYGGSGLGLSIVKNLGNLMNGAIRVESKLGEGSEFIVEIPFTKGNVCGNIELSSDGQNLRVLVVDDEDIERNYIKVVLERMGVRNTCVSDGEEAIRELSSQQGQEDSYQICLIDWKMPNMDGIETTREIREKFGENVLVIVVSAYEHNQAGESASEAGANMFIPKPLFQSALYDLFMTFTGGHMAERENKDIFKTGNFEGKRVLLAEDNAMNRMVAEALLGKLGTDCESAEDGNLALEKFCQSPEGYYDAILMDVQMPNMDGMEATRRIRESSHPDAAGIQIIALTANAFNEDIAKSLSCGMNAHVSKPIDTEELAEALDKAFVAVKK
ncbi:MAG: response regulator [Clostridiales bacterium]|nr:response regulator [Clostridiales bacterium]